MSRSRGLLPDFLVIGAMKAGTTTLYFDLASQTDICMSEIKEPSVLIRFPEHGPATAYYERQFAPEHPEQRLGEASTEYTKLPRHQGVAERARSLLGGELRLIYLVRNPVERAVSHHHHAFSRGVLDRDIDAVIRREPTLVDFGRYAMQLEPWIESFGLERILVLRFEDYVRDRAAAIRRIGAHLGIPVDPARLPLAETFNKGEGTHQAGRVGPLVRSDLYRLYLRKLVPERLRQRLRRVLQPPSPPRPPPPRPDTVDLLIDRLTPDADRLASLLGWPAPIWDLAATRQKYAAAPRPG